ncbi:MAG: L,D-transpeptidase [Nannocystaceae bacterium]|nr:L,D-transpeptidase [Nannocystaceae bacterium]
MSPSQRRICALFALVSACARAGDGRVADAPSPSQAPQPTSAAPRSPTAAAAVAVASEDDDVAIELFEPDRSTEIVSLPTFTDVFAEPRLDAARLGVLAIGERVRVHEAISTQDCETGWRPLVPQGFLCAEVEPTHKPASDTILPRLPRGSLVPGTYAKLSSERSRIYASLEDALAGRGGVLPDASLTVRRIGSASHGGREFWRTRHGYVAANELRKLDTSRFRGAAVGDALAQPRAWARFRGNDGTIPLRAAPHAQAELAARMPARHSGTVLATSDDGRFVELALAGGERGWASRDDVRIAERVAPPAGIADDERWLDIDVSQQVLVAYVGARPVYATLVSTGRRGHDTPEGSFRIERKVAERTMSSRPGDDDPYAVDRVPWTAYFVGSYALHAAYWHGSFGERKSHGCVNLAPADARHLYAWTGPGVHPGYAEVLAAPQQPGSLVRIRDGAPASDEGEPVVLALAEIDAP